MRKLIAYVLVLATVLSLLTPTRIRAAEVEHIASEDIYYSDDYFAGASTEYNPHLATLSAFMADRSIPIGNPKDASWYATQTDRLKKFFNQIHFTDFACNEDYVSRTRFDSIGIGAAKREMTFSDGTYTVIAVVPRSGDYFVEWGNNVWLGDGSKSDYMHEGWYNAANKLIDFLAKYVSEQNITGNIKLWIAGYSRGGATANIAAALLDNQIQAGKQPLGSRVTLSLNNLFAYTFEAPQGANINSKTVKPPYDALYNNIWNIIHPDDLVPKVAMSQWGFTRFGRDKYMTTKFYDPSGYDKNYKTILAMWKAHNTDAYKAQEFAMYGTPIEKVVAALGQGLAGMSIGLGVLGFKEFANILTKDTTKSNYDANIAVTLFLEELTKHVGSRQDYCKRIQTGLKDFLMIFMNDEGWSDAKDLYTFGAGALAALLLAGGGLAITGSPTFVEKAIEAISLAVPIPKTKEAMQLLMPLMEAVASTYWERPNEMISIIKYIDNIFANHLTEVFLAHMQAQDSYYVDTKNKSGGGLSLVPLRDNADFGRMSFFGFNDIGLRTGGRRMINIDGHFVGKSDVEPCPAGYAAGYYSYATEEKLEIFFPAGKSYNISMDGYSKKPFRHVEYHAYYQYFRINAQGKIRRELDSYSSTHTPLSSRVKRDVNVR